MMVIQKKLSRSPRGGILCNNLYVPVNIGNRYQSVYGVGKGFSNALNMDYKNSHILLTGYNYDELFGFAEQLGKKLL